MFYLQVKKDHPKLGQKQLKDVHYCIHFEDLTKIATSEKPLFILRQVCGHESFRESQKESIESVLLEIDTLALLPAGGEKTVIYAIISILTEPEGVTVVIQSLKSLMEEQVSKLRGKGIPAYFLNRSLPDDQIEEVINILTNRTVKYAILFTGPEWFQEEQFKKWLQTLKSQNRLRVFCVDEAHCIDLWGGSFRSSYSKLDCLKGFDIPVIALSGTTTERTVNVIKETLKLADPFVYRMSFQRKNLELNVTKKNLKAVREIVTLIYKNYPNQCGIVYCSKTNTAQDICHALKTQGISSTFFHVGLQDHNRRFNEKLWFENQAQVICATKSFCMGIDKSDVKFVYHFDMPESMDDYFQQVSRAGRDGSRGFCTLLFRIEDRAFHMQNLTGIKDKPEQDIKLNNLNLMTNFCLQNIYCRHKLISNYFGEDFDSCDENWDICANNTVQGRSINMTQEAKFVMNCLKEMKRCSTKVTSWLLLLTLMGSNVSEVITRGFHNCEHFGVGKAFTKQVKNRRYIVQKLIITLILDKIFLEHFKVKDKLTNNSSMRGTHKQDEATEIHL